MLGSMAGTSLQYLPWICMTEIQYRLGLTVYAGQVSPAPTKLYLPMVSELAALSNRKE